MQGTLSIDTFLPLMNPPGHNPVGTLSHSVTFLPCFLRLELQWCESSICKQHVCIDSLFELGVGVGPISFLLGSARACAQTPRRQWRAV